MDPEPFPTRQPSFLRLRRIPGFGAIGASLYLAGFALPLEHDLPLIALALCGLLAALTRVRSDSAHTSSLGLPVLGFILATGLSTLVSVDPSRSLQLGAALLPAVLLYFVIAERFEGLQDTRRLYLVCSAVGLSLSCGVLWTAISHSGQAPISWVADIGSPLVVVPNDGAFLAIIAPLSLTLLYREPRRLVGIVALLSLLFSLCAVCVLHSRVALLTLIAALTCAATLLQPRLGLACGGITLLIALLVDGFLGFPLMAKFGRLWDARLSLWWVAWAMFLRAPLLGHGPHTFGLLYRPQLQDLSLPRWLPLDPHTNVPWAHNLYLEILAEQGILGLAALGFLLLWGVSGAWRTYRSSSHEGRTLIVGALAGLGGLCLAALVELTLMRQWVVVMLFFLLGVIAQVSSLRIYTHRR